MGKTLETYHTHVFHVWAVEHCTKIMVVHGQSPSKRPCEKDFNLPTTKEECDQMFNLMTACGIDRATGITILKERKEKFEQAVKEYESKKAQVNLENKKNFLMA